MLFHLSVQPCLSPYSPQGHRKPFSLSSPPLSLLFLLFFSSLLHPHLKRSRSYRRCCHW